MSKKIYSVFFSATGTTEKIASRIGFNIASELKSELEIINFTPLKERSIERSFTADDIVILATPTYAGRVPNLIVKYVQSIKGNGAIGVPVVLFGNRSFDDSLMELRNIMVENGFTVIGAGAFVGAHSFSYTLGKGRPDTEDMSKADMLSLKVIEKIKSEDFSSAPVEVKGRNPIGPYYTPLGLDGEPVNILKVRPLTNDKCDNCGLCAMLCPMGSIDPENPKEYIGKGICIKCGACVKKCPKGAKYYTDEQFLSHKAYIEQHFERRAESEIYF